MARNLQIDMNQRRIELIERFLHYTTEPFDDWEYDGKELRIYFNDNIEIYKNTDLRTIIKGFVVYKKRIK